MGVAPISRTDTTEILSVHAGAENRAEININLPDVKVNGKTPVSTGLFRFFSVFVRFLVHSSHIRRGQG